MTHDWLNPWIWNLWIQRADCGELEQIEIDQNKAGDGLVRMCAQLLQSCPTLVTPWTIARQVPLSMGFPRQEYWSGLPCPPPGNLLHPGVQPAGDGLVVTSTPKSALDGNVDSETEGPENVISTCLADFYLHEPS